MNDRVNEVHEYYGSVLKKRGGDRSEADIIFEKKSKMVDELSKKNEKLAGQVKEEVIKSSEVPKLLKINDNNVKHYEEVIRKMKI